MFAPQLGTTQQYYLVMGSQLRSIRLACASVAVVALACFVAIASMDAAQAQPVSDDVVDALASKGTLSVSLTIASNGPDARVAVLNSLPANVQVVAELQTAPVLMVQVTNLDDLATLQQLDGISSVTIPPQSVRFAGTSQPNSSELNAARPQVGAEQMYAMGIRGAGSVIAVLDSGIDAQHPDLASSVVFERCYVPTSAQSCPNGTNEQSGPGAALDDDGHGTEIAGIITSDGIVAPRGIAPEAALEVFKVGGAVGLDLADVLLALDYIAANRPAVDVINVSIASDALFTTAQCGPTLWPDFYDVVMTLRASGVLVVAPTGNQAQNGLSAFPACLDPVLSVTATAFEGTLLPSANIDSSTDIAAPGSQVATTGLGGITSLTTGSSFATPIVAACAALVAEDGAGSPAAIESRLESNPSINARAGFSVPSVACIPLCAGKTVTVNLAAGQTPTPLADVILGTDLGEEIVAGMGDDTVCALGGDDLIVAGIGNDLVFAGKGNDTMFGGPGSDVMNGQIGDDRVNGGDGDDRLYGSWGHDIINGGAGADRLFGRVGRDIISGEGGNDFIHGGIGQDTIFGGDGDDELVLGKGGDTAFGDDGDDILRGKGGWDFMQGGNGNDTCFGGFGVDSQLDCESVASVP